MNELDNINEGLREYILGVKENIRNDKRFNIREEDKEYTGQAIYAIINPINGSVYLGECVSFKVRLVQHRSVFKNGAHIKELQDIYNNGGQIEIQILEKLEGFNESELRKIESKYIDEYMKNGLVYNQLIYRR